MYNYHYKHKVVLDITEQDALYNFYEQMIAGDPADNVNYFKGKGKRFCEKYYADCYTEYQYRKQLYKLFKEKLLILNYYIENSNKKISFSSSPIVNNQSSTNNYSQIDDTKSGLGKIASAFFGHPSRKLNLVGVTGTNGKTTIASLLSCRL